MVISYEHYRRYVSQEISSEEMEAIEENAESLGFDKRLMMENAGATLAYFVKETTKVEGKIGLVICGTGNNGGDGFVIARHLRNFGCNPSVILIGKRSEIRTNESKSNWILLENMGDIERIFLPDSSLLPLLMKKLHYADFIVDAILGTGVKGPLKEPLLSCVNAINESGKLVFAVDTPTGLNPSSGEIHGKAVRAKYTITFHKMKKGFKGLTEYTGKVVVREIGIPFEAEFLAGPGDIRRAIKPRRLYSHKGDYGYVLIVGGSEMYSGAPVLAGLSSLRTGAGLVYVLAPPNISNTIRQMSPDIIVQEMASDHLDIKSVLKVEKLLDKLDALVIGPGLGLHEDTVKAIPLLVSKAKGKVPIVLDADGFKSLRSCPEVLEGVVATPHAGEFKHVFSVEVNEKWQDRVDEAVKVAEKYKFTLVLKGHDTLITDGQKVKVNRWNTPGMAVAGTGDVLSGIIATFLAQKHGNFLSAVAATYVHGDAGKRAVEKKGFHILASDIVEAIPETMKPFDTEEM